MIDIINYNSDVYPSFQAEGNAAQFALPFAKKFCIGTGYDIGCNRVEWSLPNSIPIDITIKSDNYCATILPDNKIDYIFSSHCLEHIDDWVNTLNYWCEKLKENGILFLYLPDFSQQYWRPWNNKRHKHAFTREILIEYYKAKKFKNVFCSGIDLNSSFMIVGEK